jgi:hypothetical protein
MKIAVLTLLLSASLFLNGYLLARGQSPAADAVGTELKAVDWVETLTLDSERAQALAGLGRFVALRRERRDADLEALERELLAASLASPPDFELIGAAVDQISVLEADLRIRASEHLVAFAGLLTPAQRETLRSRLEGRGFVRGLESLAVVRQ